MNRWLLFALAMSSASSCMRFAYTKQSGLVVGEPITRVRTLREGKALAALDRAKLEREGAAARASYNANVRSADQDAAVLTPPPLISAEPR